MSVELYAVGGWVRDKILGIETNDLDFSCVAPSWDTLVEYAHDVCDRVWVVDPRFYTIRGRHPVHGDVDFVWARKDGAYSDGRRPDSVQPGTLEDDLARRDFTFNAMAVPEEHAYSLATMSDPASVIIDPHNGYDDMLPHMGSSRIIRCVGDPIERFTEDGLRPWRALRFAITHSMSIHDSVKDAMMDEDVYSAAMTVASERVQQEMFKAVTRGTFLSMLTVLQRFPSWAYALEHTHGVWFKPTLETK